MPWIDRCLASLTASTHPTTILVIDNGSADGTPAFIRQHYPDLQMIISEGNLGFGQANNIGLRIAIQEGAGHVFLLNQDAWVEPETIGNLVNTQQENPQFGILSPLHYDGRGEGLDEYFLTYLLQSSIRDWVGDLVRGLPGQRIIGTGFVNAAAWLISADCLRSTGFFDPVFFHYGEDENYAQRVLFHGSQIGIHTGSRIGHDREDRLLKEKATAPEPWSPRAAKKEWMQVLIRATDIRRPGYKVFLLRRMARHSLSGLTAFLSLARRRARYHGFILKNMVSHWTRIGESRSRSLSTITHQKKEAAPIR